MIIRRRPWLSRPIDNRGLVGWWPFYQGTLDESGNPARLGVVTTATPSYGFPGPCYRFPNSGNITCGSSDALSANRVSVCCWFNPAASQRHDLVTSWNLGNTSADQFDLLVGVTGGTAEFFITNASPVSAAGTTTLTSNKWWHIAGTFDGTNIRLYLNGLLEGSSVHAITIGNGSGRNYIIGNNATGGNATNGLLADVRIYNRTLSAAEIFALSQEAYQPKARIEEINLFHTTASGFIPAWAARGSNLPVLGTGTY